MVAGFKETKTHEITVDIVILTLHENMLKVLLVKRTKEPFKNRWAIPGGFVRLSENLDDAALRILKEKSNVQNVYLEQLYTFGDPLRYPNSRVITCAYFALLRYEDVKLQMFNGSLLNHCRHLHLTTKKLLNIHSKEPVKDSSFAQLHSSFCQRNLL